VTGGRRRRGAPLRIAILKPNVGGLTALVSDDVDGLVTEPTGAAVAVAVEPIASEPELPEHLSRGARATAARVTPARAEDELRPGPARVRS